MKHGTEYLRAMAAAVPGLVSTFHGAERVRLRDRG